MNFTIKKNFSADVYGISGVAVKGNWADTGMKLMNKMWEQVKAHNLKHKGINIWVYEGGDQMFAGVELEGLPPPGTGLELKQARLPEYVYYKHIGPYDKIGQACTLVLEDLRQQGIATRFPYLEIYGHWTADSSKLETEMLWCKA